MAFTGIVDVEQLGDADGGGLAHVRVLVFEALSQRLAQVLDDLVHADAAHGAHSQRTDQRVWVLTVLQKTTYNQHTLQLKHRHCRIHTTVQNVF